MKAPLKFYKSGLPSHVNSDPTTKDQSTAELLKWISDVTIKRRQIRRSTHCSNLFAEAVLSSALRKAKRDLAQKQEEKRRKLRLFCISRSKDDVDSDIELSPVKKRRVEIVPNHCQVGEKQESDRSCNEVQVTCVMKDITNYCEEPQNCFGGSSSNSSSSGSRVDSDSEDTVKACLSSLESFFDQLKSVKVRS